MATKYYGETDRTRGVLTYSSSQTDTSVTITASSTLQAMSYYGSGYRISTWINGEQVATKLDTVPEIYYSFTNAFSTSSASRTFTRKTSSYTVRVESTYGGEYNPDDYAYAGGKSGSTYVDITIPALASYTVSYNANGGSGAPSSQTKTYGTTLKLSSTKPTRTGYTFKGWGTSSSDTSVDYAAGANYTANSGITLYAIWQINTYTVSYNANGGEGAPGNQTKTYGTNLTLSSTKPTRTGYTFKGWATNASGTVAYSAGGTYSTNSGTTLYAVWEIITYTISYNKNTTDAVTNLPTTQSKNHGSNITISSITPNRSGYDFLGWTTNSSTTAIEYIPGALYTENTNLTLYAVWKLSYQTPTFSEVEVYRCDSLGNASNEGTYIKVKANISTFNSSYRTDNAYISIKQAGTQISNNQYNLNGATSIDKTVGPIGGGTYDVILAVSDSGSTDYGSITQQVLPSFFTADFGAEGKSIGIGVEASETNIPENGLMQVGMDADFNGKLKVNYTANSFVAASDSMDETPLNAWLDEKLVHMNAGETEFISMVQSNINAENAWINTYGFLTKLNDAFAYVISWNVAGFPIRKSKINGVWTNLDFVTGVDAGGTGATTAEGAIANIINNRSIEPKSIKLPTNQYYDSSTGYAGLDLSNSDMINVNGIYFKDSVDSAGEGINFYRSATAYDRLYSYSGTLYYEPNAAMDTHAATRYAVYHEGGATIPINKGGTGATSASAARTALGAAASSHNHAASNITSGTLSADRLPMGWKTASVTFSSNCGSFSASGVTTSSTIVATRGDSSMDGSAYAALGAADCSSNGTIQFRSHNTGTSSTWTVHAWWNK